MTAGGDNTGEGKEDASTKKQISGSDFLSVSFIVNILCEHEEVSGAFWAFFFSFFFLVKCVCKFVVLWVDVDVD